MWKKHPTILSNQQFLHLQGDKDLRHLKLNLVLQDIVEVEVNGGAHTNVRWEGA